MLRRLWAVLGVSAAAVVLGAGPASAHLSGGVEPGNFAATMIVTPLPAGVSVSLSPDGAELTVTSTVGTLLAPGYTDEPYLQIGPENVQRNDNSPATYLNVDVEGDAPLPANADPTAAPAWVTVADVPAFSWHDHRTHWMGAALPPEVVADPDRAHLVSEWEVPLSYDGQPVTVSGTLRWIPPPSSLPWTVGAVALVTLGASVGGRARWSTPLLALLAGAVLAELVHLATGQRPVEDPVFALVTAAFPVSAAAALLVLAVRAARAATSTAPYAVTLAGLLLLIQGLGDVPVFWNSQLAAAGPAWLTRLAVLLTLGLGAGVALGGLRVLRRSGVPTGDAVSAGPVTAG